MFPGSTSQHHLGVIDGLYIAESSTTSTLKNTICKVTSKKQRKHQVTFMIKASSPPQENCQQGYLLKPVSVSKPLPFQSYVVGFGLFIYLHVDQHRPYKIGLVRSQKKMILFGNFSQTSDTPPPFGNPLSKKNFSVYFAF